jgi:hypothetical protein
MNYTVILDLSILIVLGVTIFFCWNLNRKILALQDNKKEMIDFIKGLDSTIIKAHHSIVSLKEATETAAFERNKYFDEANQLAKDLSFMIDSGNRLIGRIERLIERGNNLEELLEKRLAKLEKKSEITEEE